MVGFQLGSVSRVGSAFALVVVALVAVAGPGRAQDPKASGQDLPPEDSRKSVDITVQNAVAKVGEKAVIVARISVHDGLEITNSYRHRLTDLSSEDVEFERQVVRGVIEDGVIVFTVPVTPKRPGVHPVHGLFRFSYHYGNELDIRSARFEATVTGTE